MATNQDPMANFPKPDRKVGPIIVTLIVILALIATAIYLFVTDVNSDTVETQPATQQNLNTQSDLDNLSQELNDIDSELNALDSENF